MASSDIQDLLEGQMTGGNDLTSGDNCFLWDSAAQAYITLFKADTGGALPSLDGKWVVAGGGGTPPVATQDVTVGSAFWLVNQQAGAQEVCLKGDVPVAATGSVEIVEGFNFVSYPFAADIALNGTSLAADGAKAGTDLGNADSIYAWDQDAQSYIVYFLADTSGAIPALDGNWVVAGGGGVPALASNDLALTRGYFYSRVAGQGTLTWGEGKPYSL
jgi:hypothetical protein